MENQEQEHKRRSRYSGTHPKEFKDKYKELQPEEYPETVDKLMQKGKTPAGMHISICVGEILDFLQIKPGQIGLDATLGYGGHSTEMLKCLEGSGHLYALDVDPIEIVKTRERLAGLGFGMDIFSACQLNFADVDQLRDRVGDGFDFALADLGISSMQIDNPERGFSFKFQGPLDLRLDPEQGITASQRLKSISQDELCGMLIENSDEPYAEIIAKAICAITSRGIDIATTTQLQQIISNVLGFIPAHERKEAIKKSCQRTFQSLRIDINNEFEVLFDFLEKLPSLMKSGGRVAILTFHSGEDRLVKKSFKALLQAGVYREIASEPIRPSEDECRQNSRARSAKLRWAIKA